MTGIQPLTPEYDDYLHDESRSVGQADLIAFPQSEGELREVLRELYPNGKAITFQGARTGLAAGAVPDGGCIVNLSRMNSFLGMRIDEHGGFFLRLQPGVMLLELNQALRGRSLPSEGWDATSRAALDAFLDAPLQVFPVDPTETSASLGGIVACNASGAKSYRYGAVRNHISALRMMLSDGDVLDVRRRETYAHNRSLSLHTDEGRTIEAHLPSYDMPQAKCASGYFVADGMDAIDAVIGSDGTLGAITELEIKLMPSPASVWDVSCFLPHEDAALDFVERARSEVLHATSIEYIDAAAIDILRKHQQQGGGAADLPTPPDGEVCCVALEIACDDDDDAMEDLESLMGILEDVDGDADATWVASTEAEREEQRAFRHAVPESVNRLIDERKRTYPTITKLGSDMSVPPARLFDAMALYRRTLAREGLQSATWGHIGDAHVHVNILPQNEEEYARGKALFSEWAREITAMGGAVSAEHGVGKLKRDFLATMYGEAALREMARFKLAFDPKGQLGRGNFFDAALLDAKRANDTDLNRLA